MAFISLSSQLLRPFGRSSYPRRRSHSTTYNCTSSSSCCKTGRSIPFTAAVDSSSTFFRLVSHTHTKLLILLCAASSPVFHLLSQSPGSIVVFFCFPLPQMAGAVCRVCLEHLLLFQFELRLRVCSNQSIVFFTFVVITVLVSGLASASAGRTNASSWSRRKCSS